MSDYVLIHGALNAGSVWDAVGKILRGKGHRVFAPTLTPPQNIGLADNINEVCSLIEREKLENVILAGHSYAALVITGVFDRMPERFARLIYIDSSIPASGRSLYGLIEDYGGSVAGRGLPQFKPFTDALLFDEERWRKVPKVYIRCTRSEFADIGNKAFSIVKARADWTCCELDSKHHCMTEKPQETAQILTRTVP